MKLITASEARRIYGTKNRTTVVEFNKLIREAIDKKTNLIHLPVATTTENFVLRLKKAKYDVSRIGRNYLITWKRKNEIFLN